MKNTILMKQTMSNPKDADNEAIELENIKDDVCLIQFKLVHKFTLKQVNTFSFINMPSNKASDINLEILQEILSKQSQKRTYAKRVSSAIHRDYLPYNKSILTRILYQQLKK